MKELKFLCFYLLLVNQVWSRKGKKTSLKILFEISWCPKLPATHHSNVFKMFIHVAKNQLWIMFPFFWTWWWGCSARQGSIIWNKITQLAEQKRRWNYFIRSNRLRPELRFFCKKARVSESSSKEDKLEF